MNILNFADDEDDEKRLVGLRLAAPQAKISWQIVLLLLPFPSVPFWDNVISFAKQMAKYSPKNERKSE